MKYFSTALWAEYMKIRKSKILWITLILFAFIPLMMGLMIYIVRNPDISAKLGLIAAKASMFGNADWPSFLGILNQAIAGIGIIGFGFVTAWVYGREHTERTMKDILALPISRNYIVLAKCVIVFIWCILLTLVLFASGIIVGWLIGMENWSQQAFYANLHKYFISALLTLLLCPPVAFFAGYGRGLIAPIGFALVTMIMAQFIAVAGMGAFFPWAVPGLFTAPEGAEGMQLYTSSYIILALTSIFGYLATLYWWRHADQH
jgi:hypothetical protein